MGERPLVSVVIPSYNHERFLQEAIDSVLAQTYPHLELIVIDDGSADGSRELLRKVTDPRVRLHFQENQGADAAINQGLAEARGEIISILNSDDAYEPGRLARLVEALVASEGVDLVGSWIRVVDEQGKELALKKGWENLDPWPMQPPEDTFKRTGSFELNLLASNFVATTSNMVFTRTLRDRVGGMRPLRFTHDWDFLLRACREGKCKLVEQPLLRYRLHGKNTIGSDRRRMLFEICWVLAANLEAYHGVSLFGTGDGEKLAEQAAMLHASVNLQGNDRLLWVMLALIGGLRAQGVSQAEDRLLTDPLLRESLIALVADDSRSGAGNLQPLRRAWAKAVGLAPWRLT